MYSVAILSMEQPYTERIFSLCLFVAFVHF